MCALPAGGRRTRGLVPTRADEGSAVRASVHHGDGHGPPIRDFRDRVLRCIGRGDPAGFHGGNSLDSNELAGLSCRAATRVARQRRPRPSPEADRLLSPAGVRRRGPFAAVVARPGGRRQRLPLAGRRLRRELRGVLGRQHPREAARHPADGRRADLLARRPGGEGRAHRRPVRQAAFGAVRAHRRRRPAELPWAHRQRRHADRGGSRAVTGSAGAGVQPVGIDVEPAARVHQGRLRRPQPGARVDAGVRRQQPGGAALRADRVGDRACVAVHARVRHRHRGQPQPQFGRRVHEPRGAAARLRGSAHPPGHRRRRLVRLLGPHALDRRAHPSARRRARRVPARRRQPARLQDRADHVGRVRARAVREAQPDAHPRSRHADQPHGRARRRGRAATAAACSARRRPPRGVGVRPDARQHVHVGNGPQDPRLRRDHAGDRGLRPGAPRRGHVAGRHPHRAHRRQRHRVRRWRRQDPRQPARRSLPDGVRPAAERSPEPRPRVPRGRAAALPRPGLRTASCWRRCG